MLVSKVTNHSPSNLACFIQLLFLNATDNICCSNINCLVYLMFFLVYVCTGFPLQHGKQSVLLRSKSDCTTLNLRPYLFYPDKPVQVQVTVNHHGSADKEYVHDAAVSWVEKVTYENFQVCLAHAGHNERRSFSNVSFDWMAYQGAPEGGVAGKVRVRKWWTGTTCETVQLPAVSSLR